MNENLTATGADFEQDKNDHRESMGGYVGFSMSKRAAEAYSGGALPLSKITAGILRENGISLSLADFKALAKAEVVSPDSWHHTSKIFNHTDFYNLHDCREQIAALSSGEISVAIQRMKDAQAAKNTTDSTVRFVEVTYDEWGPYGRFGKNIFRQKSELAIAHKQWLYLESGGKKRADGTHIVSVVDRGTRKPHAFNAAKREIIMHQILGGEKSSMRKTRKTSESR